MIVYIILYTYISQAIKRWKDINIEEIIVYFRPYLDFQTMWSYWIYPDVCFVLVFRPHLQLQISNCAFQFIHEILHADKIIEKYNHIQVWSRFDCSAFLQRSTLKNDTFMQTCHLVKAGWPKFCENPYICHFKRHLHLKWSMVHQI